MLLKIFYYRINISPLNSPREGFLIETTQGWGEVAPLPGYSRENLNEVFYQLKELKNGKAPKLLPSVAFGLFSCTQEAISWPASGLLMGTRKEIIEQAKKLTGFTSVKLKIKSLLLSEAIKVAQELKNHFRLRVDVEGKWSLAQAHEFCAHFKPDDFDYIEDPLSDPKDLFHFPFPIGSDAIKSPIASKAVIWKPTLRGIPKTAPNLVLSSAFESGIGIGKLVQLAHTLKLHPHPIGLGTYHYLSETLLEEPLVFSNGKVYVPKLKPNLKYVHQL